jgi:hypothetical protein
MIRPDRVKAELFGGVGWRQGVISGYPVIDAANLASSSGLYYQDGCSFVTTENVYDNQQEVGASDANFNAYLTQLQESAILEVCQKIDNNESDFVQSVNLYPYEKSFSDTITHSGRFVGFEIERRKSVNMLGKIGWVEVAFDTAATFNLYLYNSNKPNAPIVTQEVTTVAGESVVVNLDDWYIADDNTFKGGTFYVGYFEDDLGAAKAYAKNWEASQYQRGTKCHNVYQVSLEHSGTAIDVTSNISPSDTFGLNIGIDIYTDYTELFIRNRAMLYQAIQYQVAEKVFHLISTSSRFNANERANESDKQEMAFEVYGNKELGIEGVNGKLTRTINNLKRTLFRKSRISVSTLK